MKPELGKAARSLLVDVLRAVMVVLGKNTDLRVINETIKSKDFLDQLGRVAPGAITQT